MATNTLTYIGDVEVEVLSMLEPEDLSLRELVNHVSRSRMAAEIRLHHFERLEATAGAGCDEDTVEDLDFLREQIASLRAGIQELDEAIQGVFWSTMPPPRTEKSHQNPHRRKVKKSSHRIAPNSPPRPRRLLTAPTSSRQRDSVL